MSFAVAHRSSRVALSVAIAISMFSFGAKVEAQRKKKESRFATVQGVIKNDPREAFSVKYEEIKTALRKVVTPKEPPVPRGWEKMNAEDRQAWLTKFLESDVGKKFVADREKEVNDAPSFDVKYNDQGDFVVYDVPPGDYGLQGRVDKEIEGVNYGFEVFARIKVLADVDQIKLEPIPVEITPLLKNGQAAPPLDLLTSKGEKLSYDLDAYKDRYIFLNFMNTTDQTPEYQRSVQDMYKQLRDSHRVKLISVVLDDDATKAIKWLINKQYTQGSYAFTKGWDDKTVRDYGVRSTPSGWIISPDRKILMNQHEFFQLARVKKSVAEIVRDRIEGKDTPTLATEEPEKETADNK